MLDTVATALALALVAGCGDDDDPVAVADKAVASEHDHGATSPAIHTEAGHEFQDQMRSFGKTTSPGRGWRSFRTSTISPTWSPPSLG